MGYHQIKKLLQIKGNNCQNEKTTYRMGKIKTLLFIRQRIIKSSKTINTKRTNNPVSQKMN
jgi:hypothetical protein